jgi:hypothetical protein
LIQPVSGAFIMEFCKHHDCDDPPLAGSAYCQKHQLATGKVSQFKRDGGTTRGGDSHSSIDDLPGRDRNPSTRGGQDKRGRGPSRGGPGRGGKR